MRLILTCLHLLLASIISFSQATREELLTKSNNQKTAARVMLAGGIVLIGVGYLVGNGENADFDQAATGGIMAVTGIVSGLGSIPLFIASKRNKKKSMSVSAGVNIEGTYPLSEGGYFPALALKIKWR
jgi:hypothetical protein